MQLEKWDGFTEQAAWPRLLEGREFWETQDLSGLGGGLTHGTMIRWSSWKNTHDALQTERGSFAITIPKSLLSVCLITQMSIK